MTHYWLTDTDGSQYINNPGGPNHASKSNDGGVTWDRPRNINTVVQREERMAEIMEMAERNREAERKRLGDLAAQQKENLAANVLNYAFGSSYAGGSGKALIGQTLSAQIESLRSRERVCWDMSEVFLHSRDAHGLHDMGVEIQGIQWAIRELEKVVT